MSDLSGTVLNENNKFVNKYGEPLKPKAERVKEAVTILSKLRELGVPVHESGYYQTKERLDEWVQGGDSWSGRIDFPRFQRKADLSLPVKIGRVASMVLRAPKKH